MVIRELTPLDGEQYRSLRLLSLSEAPTASWASHDEEESLPASVIEARMAASPWQVNFGAFENDRLVAMASLKREAAKKIRHRANIWGVYVAPVARRKGLARELMHAMISHASHIDGLEQLTLVVNSANTVAAQLYASLGFRMTGIDKRSTLIDNAYHDELRMLLILRPD